MNRILKPILTRIHAVVGRAILSAVNDSTNMQLVKVEGLSGEVLGNMEHPQPFGFSAHCPPGGHSVVVFVGGSRDQGINIINDYPEYRQKGLDEGESVVYSKGGVFIKVKNDAIKIEIMGGEMEIAGKVASSGDLKSTGGDVSDKTGTLDKVRKDLVALKTAYNSHTHIETGGTTNTPLPLA